MKLLPPALDDCLSKLTSASISMNSLMQLKLLFIPDSSQDFSKDFLFPITINL